MSYACLYTNLTINWEDNDQLSTEVEIIMHHESCICIIFIQCCRWWFFSLSSYLYCWWWNSLKSALYFSDTNSFRRLSCNLLIFGEGKISCPEVWCKSTCFLELQLARDNDWLCWIGFFAPEKERGMEEKWKRRWRKAGRSFHIGTYGIWGEDKRKEMRMVKGRYVLFPFLLFEY